MLLTFSVNNRRFTTKPSLQEIQQIHHHFERVTLSIEDLMGYIECGQTFTCGTFKDNIIKSSHFIGQQIFCADFDHTLTLEQATDILKEYGLGYTFGYYTFRHTAAAPRFRLVFVLDGEVRGVNLAKDINTVLFHLFGGKIDMYCKDATRLWFGSRNQCFKGSCFSQPINLKAFLEAVNFAKYSSDKKQYRSCVQVDAIEARKCANTGNTIIYSYSITPFSTKNASNSIPPEVGSDKVKNWKVEDLFQVELFKRFYHGQASGKADKLSHMELFGLATNLICLEGGMKLFRQLLDKNPNYSPDKKNIISYVNYREFSAQHFKEFSPFESDWQLPHQTFPALLRKRGQVTITEKPVLMDLVEGEAKLQQEMTAALTLADTNIYLFRCAAGLGKTQIIKNQKNVVVAFPDHLLKEEQYKTSSLMEGDEKLATPILKNAFSKPINTYFDALYATDLAMNVMMEVKRLAAGELVLPDQTLEDALVAKRILEQFEAVKEAGDSKTIFTTHTRALQTEWLHSTVVYDESPLSAILEQHEASVAEMYTLMRLLPNGSTAKDALNTLLQEEDFEEPKPTPRFGIDSQLIYQICSKQRFTSHVFRFFKSNYYCIKKGRILYSISNEQRFSLHKKYIICDATASIEVYQKLFGKRLKVIDISNVENKGEIHQYTSYSCSKTGIETAFEKLPIDQSLPTITFLSQKQQFENATPDLHFGRVRGSNQYSGRSINVVGTFHYGNEFYRFLGAQLGIESESWDMQVQSVTYNGRSFRFMTFSDPTLQKIQLETVEGELVQAVQRARLLRTNATVYLYSNFPLQQAQYRY